MADMNNKTTKARKPFFWRRREPIAAETVRLASDIEADQTNDHPWYRPTVWKAAAAAAIALVLLPGRANGQFGVELAAILAALSKVESLMNTYVAAPLKTINQAQQSIATYEQEIVYPIAGINQARSSVTQFENQFSQLTNMFKVNVSSATLPQSQNLESLLLSRNTANISTVSPQFQNVYGVVMPQNAASPQLRNMTDMTDAQAQDAMKRAIQIDADRKSAVQRKRLD